MIIVTGHSGKDRSAGMENRSVVAKDSRWRVWLQRGSGREFSLAVKQWNCSVSGLWWWLHDSMHLPKFMEQFTNKSEVCRVRVKWCKALKNTFLQIPCNFWWRTSWTVFPQRPILTFYICYHRCVSKQMNQVCIQIICPCFCGVTVVLNLQTDILQNPFCVVHFPVLYI